MPHRGRLLVSLETRKSFLVLFFKKERKKQKLLFEKRSKKFLPRGRVWLGQRQAKRQA
jgi:hypothetical protein